MVDATDAGPIGLRDRARILLEFGAFRRSELIGWDIADLDFGRDGLTGRARALQDRSRGCGPESGDSPYGSNPDTCPYARCGPG
jgi:hypothetical protein